MKKSDITKYVFTFLCGEEVVRELPYDVSPKGLKLKGKRPIKVEIFGDISMYTSDRIHQVLHPYCTEADIILHGSVLPDL